MARLFLALPLDESCQQQIDERVAAWLPGAAALRWTAPSNRHLTLVFLGEVSAQEQQQLLEGLDQLPTAEPFEIGFGGLQRFPDSRGHVLALLPAVEVPALMALQQAVSRWVASCGVANPEQHQRFRPHITLARIQSPARLVLPAACSDMPGEVVLKVGQVGLYSSEQHEGRRVYRALSPV